MTLEELLRWHRRQVRETEGCLREIHHDAVRLLDGIIKRKAAHDEHRRNAVAKGIAAGKKPGAHRLAPEIEVRIRQMLSDGAGAREIAAAVGTGMSVVYRVKAEMAEEE